MGEPIWSDRHAVGVEAVDDDHKRLFAVLGELESAMTRRADPPEGIALLQKLSAATGEHFSGEETMMREMKYPGLALHVANHQRLMEKLQAFLARYSRAGVEVNQHALNFLRDWLVYHVENDDHRFGDWLNARAGDLALARSRQTIAPGA